MNQTGTINTQLNYNFQKVNGPSSASSLDFTPYKNKKNFRDNPIKETGIMFFIFAAYFIAGKLGLGLAFENASATAVWAPTGIAIAAFLLRGYFIWPAILLGAFLINVTTTGHIPTSIWIAIGNTAEGLLAAYLINKYAKGKNAFENAGNIFRFALLGGILSTMVSATVGVTSLALWGLASWSNYLSVWLTWWIGDAVGAFLIVPFLILWFETSSIELEKNSIIETAAVFLLLAVIIYIEFSPYSYFAVNNYPLSFLLIPPFVWISFRFSQRFVASAAFLLCAVTIWGTLHSYGPFVINSRNDSLLILQSFIGLVTVMSLVFAAIVSEHKQTEKKLRETERLKWEEFYMLLERLPAGAYTCDKSGLITYFNEQAVKIWGREPKLNNPVDMYCGSFKLYINNDPIKHEECWMARAIMDNKEYNGEEILIERPDGSTIEVLAHANPIRNKTGELVGAVNVLVDVSEMKKVQVALSEAYGKMEERVQERTAELRKTQAELIHSEKLASLGRFSAGIAHEIRNPLANISSLAQLLLKKNSNAEINQHLNYILANSDIANRIIKDLLNIASQDNTSSSKIDLSVLLANICNSAEARCNKSKIVINKEIDFNIPGVKGNEDKLYAAFMNFISNAIDSMPNGGNLIVTAKFDAPKADSPSGEVVITFEDEGVGIPEENLTKVLEPFFTTKNEGTGLGLTLAYNVIRAHNGKIEIESEKDIGTKFTIRLPVNQS